MDALARAAAVALVVAGPVAVAAPELSSSDASESVPAAARVLRVRTAAKVVVARAAVQQRPDFHIESTRRLRPSRVRVCWSEPGYLAPEDGRDYGCDLVELRGCGAYWVRDGSFVVPAWRRFLP